MPFLPMSNRVSYPVAFIVWTVIAHNASIQDVITAALAAFFSLYVLIGLIALNVAIQSSWDLNATEPDLC